MNNYLDFYETEVDVVVEENKVQKISVNLKIKPVAAVTELTYDISGLIEMYIRNDKTKEEARRDFSNILKEIIKEEEKKIDKGVYYD